MFTRRTLLSGLALLYPHLAIGSAARQPRFAMIGDTPYSLLEELQLLRMIARLNSLDLDFVIHLGDIKNSRELCTRELLAARAALFGRLQVPLIYTPGDNDWADCRRHGPAKTTTSDQIDKNESSPLAAKALLHEVWFAPHAPARLGDAALRLSRQNQQIENSRWQFGQTLFTLVHSIGSNDNAGFDAANDKEQRRRAVLNQDWLNESLHIALDKSVTHWVIGFHSSINFDAPAPIYRPLIQSIQKGAHALKKPILLIHGDTHTQRIDQPFFSSDLAHTVTRAECFGSPEVNYVVVEPRALRSNRSAWRFTIGSMDAEYRNDSG